MTIEKRSTYFRGRVITVTVDDVILPNGHRAQLELVHHPGGAAAVAIDEQERVCLLRQYRHAAGGWLWELPAGKLEPDEPPQQTARRELMEEAGVSARHWESLGRYFSSPGVFGEVLHLYLATGLEIADRDTRAQRGPRGALEALSEKPAAGRSTAASSTARPPWACCAPGTGAAAPDAGNPRAIRDTALSVVGRAGGNLTKPGKAGAAATQSLEYFQEEVSQDRGRRRLGEPTRDLELDDADSTRNSKVRGGIEVLHIKHDDTFNPYERDPEDRKAGRQAGTCASSPSTSS